MTNFNLNWDNVNKRAILPAEFKSWGPEKYIDPIKYSESPEEILKFYTRHAEGIERYIRLRDSNPHQSRPKPSKPPKPPCGDTP